MPRSELIGWQVCLQDCKQEVIKLHSGVMNRVVKMGFWQGFGGRLPPLWYRRRRTADLGRLVLLMSRIILTAPLPTIITSTYRLNTGNRGAIYRGEWVEELRGSRWNLDGWRNLDGWS